MGNPVLFTEENGMLPWEAQRSFHSLLDKGIIHFVITTIDLTLIFGDFFF
jgi:hypothetical protein